MLNEAISKMPETFDSKTLVTGQDYFQKGYVLSIRLSDGLLKGRIKDIANQIHDVHMDLKIWPGKAAHCTCSYEFNCQHAAACLFALRDREKINMDPNTMERLDKKLDVWLKNLRAKELKRPQQDITHHLVYLLQLKRERHEHVVLVELALPKLLKRGGYGKMLLINTLPESKRQHLTSNDNDIIAQLFFKCNVQGYFNTFSIRNSELLEKIIKTNRAFFKYHDESAIQMANPLEGICQWVLAPNGSQHLKLKHDDLPIDALLLDKSWYFYYEDLSMGYLNTGFPIEQLHHLLEAPPIPLEQAELFSQKMAKTCPNFPVPQVFQSKEHIHVRPVPIVVLDTQESSIQTDEAEDTLFLARVMFEYAGCQIAYQDPSLHVVLQQDDTLKEYIRDKAFEDEKINELFQTLHLRQMSLVEEALQRFHKQKSGFILETITGLNHLDDLYNRALPYLKNQGWQVEFASPLYQEVIHADEVEWFSDLTESKNDFFSYQLGILVDNHPVNIVPLVADLIHKYKGHDLDKLADDEMVQLPLKANRMLTLPIGRLKPLVRLLLQLGVRQNNENLQLEIDKYQLILMREAELALAASKARWQGAESLRQELRQLIHLKELPEIEAPKGLTTNLRDYQHHGLKWLQFLRSCRFGGILADDMGLGKTVQTLAHLQYEKEKGRLINASLIIAPTSLVGNWLAEAKRFTPELKVFVYHGSERRLDEFNDYDLIISTYGLIHRDKEKFITYEFYYLILDEAQFIKNARTKTTQIIQQLKASHRLCLTGTPLENHLGELWSLFHFLMPGLLGDAKKFRLWFRTPIEKNADLERRQLLVQRIKPFMLRRTKNQVAKELPLKTNVICPIELTGAQRDLYETIRMSMEKKVRDAIAKQGLGKSHILLLDALLKLRQVCCDPRLLPFTQTTIDPPASAKLEALMELLDNLVEEGRRVLVFSQFTSMLSLIEQELNNKKIVYLKLTGQTKNRQTMVETFQQGQVPVFLISLKAGGTGLNLTKADTVIHFDPWWNPAVEDQATDRTHRIGQLNPVFVYKLITSGTVEEAILKMQERKRQLVEGVLSTDPAKTMSLSEEDLDLFFMPLNN
ncbi:MAG: DEAD/DEAH box helicase [Legionella sp.]|nr:DEAD/DEAH box helicase [Legionella sp.]